MNEYLTNQSSTDLLAGLNPQQAHAVSYEFADLLVLAGAGSGKTRVLTHRIAHLLQKYNGSAWNVLAVTFTNKAASEMRTRIAQLLAQPVNQMWIGTFHSISNKLLRIHHAAADLPKDFRIIDPQDQLVIVKRLLRERCFDEKEFEPRKVQGYINSRKDEGLRAVAVATSDNYYFKNVQSIYVEYERVCRNNNIVDFAELLLRSYELLNENLGLQEQFHQRFLMVLVDEFQDTNDIQYRWVQKFVGSSSCLTVVGDDDQSIYGWRGAQVENLNRLITDYPKIATIRLEQNYRSTNRILKAANSLIQRNSNRQGKQLWTASGEGEHISLYAGFNDFDEARFIVDRVKHHRAAGDQLKQCSILYRANAQSRVIEETLLRADIPYRIFGGLRFYERAEIKNAVAYLRCISATIDSTALDRIINVPPRGIGVKTLQEIRDIMRNQDISMIAAIETFIADANKGQRGKAALQGFLVLLQRLTTKTAGQQPGHVVDTVINESGLLEYYKNEKKDVAEQRLDNLNELIAAADNFVGDDPDIDWLTQFLDQAALEAGDHQASGESDAINLMTMHLSKGLEFTNVFITGMEEGLFPHRMCSDDLSKLEEERRLCYVGITRAMRKLYLTYAELRRLHGSEITARPSRFIKEIDPEMIEEVRIRTQVRRPYLARSQPQTPRKQYNLPPRADGFVPGANVRHPKFGSGVIVHREGDSNDARLQVNFDDCGSKRLILEYANLQLV